MTLYKMDISEQLAALPDHSLNIVYADPPWKYQQTVKNGVLKRKDGTLLYPSMSLKELCALGPEISRVCQTDSALFMWATMPLLPEAFQVIKAWKSGLLCPQPRLCACYRSILTIFYIDYQ